MRHASSKHIFSYWRRLRGIRVAPERVDINPAALGRHLSDIFLLDCDDAGVFHFRVAGAGICALFGQELRGQNFIDAATFASADDLKEMIAAVTEDCVPVIAGVSALLSDRKSIEGELLLLPLQHNGGTRERVLGALVLGAADRLALGNCAGLEILTFRILSDTNTRFMNQVEPVPSMAAGKSERHGHLTVFEGGQR